MALSRIALVGDDRQCADRLMVRRLDPGLIDKLREAAERFGTPVYVTDVAALRRAAAEVTAAFPDPWIRQYSVKANDVPAVIREIAACGFGANVVSSGEWRSATEAGVANAQISLEGIGKTDADLRAVVRAHTDGTPLRWIAIESIEEAAVLAGLAREAGAGGAHRIDALLRLNPEVEPETTAELAVGAASSKFGLLASELADVIAAAGGQDGPLRWRGLQVHAGSQLSALDAWRDAMQRALAIFSQWRKRMPEFTTLDAGGGFPVTDEGDGPRPRDFARALDELMSPLDPEEAPTTLAIEPGRFLTARAGYLVSRVLHVRKAGSRADEPLVVIDAGMTEIIRPALYHTVHPIVALVPKPDDRSGLQATVVEGPICESTDHLGRHQLPALRRGDTVAILDSGAYASSMSSRYNGRARPPEVLLDADGRLRLGRPGVPV